MKAARLLVAGFALVLMFGARQDNHSLTRDEVLAVKTAVLDEIYDYDFQSRYVDILPLESQGYPLRVYIRPNLIDSSGQVIYKLPIGEVARVFEIRGNLAVLMRQPRDKFPPTSNSTLTLYLDDSTICAEKRDWIHETVYVNPHPSKEYVEAAITRERERKGTSQHDEIAKSHR